MDGSAIKKLGEQIARERHEQGHPYMAFVEQGQQRKQGLTVERNGSAFPAMHEMKDDDQQDRARPYVIES